MHTNTMLKASLPLIFLISLFLAPGQACAQEEIEILSDTLLWKAETLTDMVTDTTTANTSEFVTYGSSKIVWMQLGGEATTAFEFTITGTADHWTASGYVVFTTTRKSKTQTFRFERIGTITKVILTYTESGAARTYTFIIDEVTPITD